MTLISLILVFAIERMTTKTHYWQSNVYLEMYANKVRHQSWLLDESRNWSVFLMLAFPAIIWWLSFDLFSAGFLEFFASLAVLMIATGCPHVRANYKGYLQSSNRGDFAARDLYAEQLGYTDSENISFGQYVVWLNYQYYFAVALWFILLGAPGVLLYSCARHFAEKADQDWVKQGSNQALFLLDWIPVRIAALGFLLVGHFSRALPVWLSIATDMEADAKQLISKVAKASEEIEPDENDCTEEPCTLLRLSKRNIMMLLAVVAILTMSGLIY